MFSIAKFGGLYPLVALVWGCRKEKHKTGIPRRQSNFLAFSASFTQCSAHARFHLQVYGVHDLWCKLLLCTSVLVQLRRILFLIGYSSPSKTVPWGKFLQRIIVIPSGKFFPGNNSLLCTLGEAGLLSWNFSGYLLHTLLWILIQIQCPPSIFWFLIISTYNILRFDIEKKLIKS